MQAFEQLISSVRIEKRSDFKALIAVLFTVSVVLLSLFAATFSVVAVPSRRYKGELRKLFHRTSAGKRRVAR